MTKPVPVTKTAIKRGIAAAQEQGASMIEVLPDGTIRVLHPEDYYESATGEQPERSDSETGEVYVIECGEYVKIGFSLNARSRLRELQIGNPQQLKLLAVVTGGRITEAFLHARFDDLRARGEWFHHKGQLADWINERCPL